MRKLLRFIAVLLLLSAAGCPVSSDLPEIPTDPVSPEVPIDELVQRTLDQNRTGRKMSTETHGAWQILHGVLAYGDRCSIETPAGSRLAIEYLLEGGTVNGFRPQRGDPLGDPPRRGLRMDMQPSTKIGQGHRDQWLAVLSQCGLTPETEIRSADGTFTISDWLRQTEYDLPRNLELEFSWTLIALTAFRETSHAWMGRDGVEYSIEDLLHSELQQDIPASVCGGTHRLIGLSMALNKRRAEGAAMSGVWRQAETRLTAAVEMANENQNPDGSYSIAYLHRPGWNRDLGESLGTTGHVLEFLAFAAPDETLRQPWVERSVRYLCHVLDECQDVDLECGVLYHALHGLAEYQKRIGLMSATPAN